MINIYGADAVRWFILSDSPPEKDIQWSDSGVSSSNKFLQKMWNLVFLIKSRKEDKIDNKNIEQFENKINIFINKIDKSINDFKFNVAIANFYKAYNIINSYLDLDVSKEKLVYCIEKIMKLLLPIVPHLSNEVLDLLQCKTKKEWPKIEKDTKQEIKFAIQVNGKTRDIITIDKKVFENKKIIKTIFVKNKNNKLFNQMKLKNISITLLLLIILNSCGFKVVDQNYFKDYRLIETNITGIVD